MNPKQKSAMDDFLTNPNGMNWEDLVESMKKKKMKKRNTANEMKVFHSISNPSYSQNCLPRVIIFRIFCKRYKFWTKMPHFSEILKKIAKYSQYSSSCYPRSHFQRPKRRLRASQKWVTFNLLSFLGLFRQIYLDMFKNIYIL